MDVDKFTPAQLRVAAQVIDEAERQGVDPNLALAVAFAESSLNPQAKNGNAIGVMQMLPAAAKDMGIDPTDHTQNLRGGIGYLKRQLDQFKDPALAVAAYHEGAGGLRSLGQGAELADAQRHALNQYLANVQKGYPSLFGAQQESGQAAPEQQAAQSPESQAPMDVFRKPASDLLTNAPQPAPDKSPMNYAAQLFGGAAGAAAGATVATGAALPGMIRKGLQNAGAAIGQGAASVSPGIAAAGQAWTGQGPQMTSGPTSPLVPTNPQHTRQLQGGIGDQGTTGRSRQQTYIEATSAQAARAKDQADVMRRLQQAGFISGDARSVMAGMPGMASTPSGVLLPAGTVYEMEQEAAKAAAAQQAQQQAAAAAAQKQASSFGGRLKSGLQAVGRVANTPLVRGGLAGFGAGAQGAEAVSRFDRGDTPGAALATAGALSSAASMVPGLQLPGAVGGALSYGGLHALDAIRRARAQTPDNTPPTPQELEQAQRPAFTAPFRGRRPQPSPAEKISSGLMQEIAAQIPALAA